MFYQGVLLEDDGCGGVVYAVCQSDGTGTRLASLRCVYIGSGNTTRVIRFDYFITYSNYIGCKTKVCHICRLLQSFVRNDVCIRY